MLRDLLLFSLLLGVPAFPQQVDWLESSPVTWEMNPGMPEEIITSAPGHLVSMRISNVTHNYGQEIYGDVVLEKIDATTGAPLWSCMLGDSVSLDAAVVDANGLAYFAGRFQGDQLQICDGTMLPYVGNAIDENAYLLAWDLNADALLWAKNITAEIGGWHHVSALAVDNNGSLWYALEDFFEGMIIRVDAEGNAQETRTITECKRIGAVSFDPWGGMYVSGAADDQGFSFAGTTPEVAFNYAMFVLRYRPDGSAGFAAFAEDITFQAPRVVATGDGHAYLCGDVFEATDWGGFPVNGADWGTSVFLAKLDSSGTFHWLVESDPPGGDITGDVEAARNACIAVDADNNIYLTGTLRGQVDWGNGVVSHSDIISTRTITVVAFDPSGTAQWAATSEPDMNVWAQAITAGAEADAIHFASHVTSEFTFGGHTTNTGGTQAAVVGRISGISTGIDHIEDRSALLAWPSPTVDLLHLEMEADRGIPAEIFDSNGQRVQDLYLRPGRNSISMAGLSQGLYMLRLADGRAVRVVKE